MRLGKQNNMLVSVSIRLAVLEEISRIAVGAIIGNRGGGVNMGDWQRGEGAWGPGGIAEICEKARAHVADDSDEKGSLYVEGRRGIFPRFLETHPSDGGCLPTPPGGRQGDERMRPTFSGRRTARAWAAAGVLAIAGCTRGLVEVAPPVTMASAFSASGSAVLPDRWWEAFGDAALDAVMADALAGNLTLQGAWDRLDAAQAVAARSGAALWPEAGGDAGTGRSAAKSAGLDRTYASQVGVGLSASYELDLWGRVRATRDAAILDAQATDEDLRAAAITVTAEVAGTWYRLVERHGQLAILDDQIETNEKYLQVVQSRFRAGQTAAADVLQQKELVESVRGERVLVESAIEVLANQLAVLLGRMPGRGLPDVPEALPDIPPLPVTPVPARWIRRRPDVRAAELRVQSADRRVAAAIADQFPRIALSAGSDTTDEQVRNLLDNWVANVLANLTAPLLDGGARRAEVRRTRADAAERLHA